MAWIQSHKELRDHPKLFDLAQEMGWETDLAIGKLHRFWWWCVDYAEDGDLRKHNNDRLGRAVELNGDDCRRFVEAMVRASWLDREPYFRIHDWWDYAGRWLQGKYGKTPEKWQKIQQLYDGAYKPHTNRIQTADSREDKRREEKRDVSNVTEVEDDELPVKTKEIYPEPKSDLQKIIMVYKLAKGISRDDRAWDSANYKRAARPAKSILDAFGGNLERAVAFVAAQGTEWNHAGLDDWTLSGIEKQAWMKASKLKNKEGGLIKNGREGGRTLANQDHPSKALAHDSISGHRDDQKNSSNGEIRQVDWSNVVEATSRTMPKV